MLKSPRFLPLSAVVIALLLCLPSICLALFGSGSPVTTLSPKNFKKAVGRTSLPVFVKFFAPWCGHCQKFGPEYEKAATRGKGLAKFYAVNCDDEINRSICSKYNIQGFPTVKVILPKPGKAGSEKSVVDYTGPRTASGLLAQAKYYFPDYTRTITKKDAKDVDSLLRELFPGNNTKAVAILFTDNNKPSILWKRLAVAANKKMVLYTVPSRLTEVVQRFEISSEFPAILAFSDGTNPDAYESYIGPSKYDDILAFFRKVVNDADGDDSSSSSGSLDSNESASSTNTAIRDEL